MPHHVNICHPLVLWSQVQGDSGRTADYKGVCDTLQTGGWMQKHCEATSLAGQLLEHT